jgi:agmatinase
MNGIPTLLGLPTDLASSHLRGAAKAPAQIRAALACASSNSWSEGLLDLGRPELLADAGDLDLPEDGETTRSRIRAGVERLLDSGAKPLCLGGDHSVTYPVLQALGPRHTGLTLLHVDAHADLYDRFEGDPYSHACPFARIMEERLVTRLVQVGIRTLNAHQAEQAERFGVEQIDMCAWAAGVRPRLDGPVYVSIDLDGLDPSCAPGVSHWEPGGLTTRELLTLLQGLPAPVVGADLVEFNPDRDASGFTAMVCAKLVKELAERMLDMTRT